MTQLQRRRPYLPALGFLFWVLLYCLMLGWTPRPWNYDLGILLILFLFFILKLSTGTFSVKTILKEPLLLIWNKIQFIAWIAVIFSGLITFLVTRTKAGVIDPYNFSVDGTLALIFTASALVFLEEKLSTLFFSNSENFQNENNDIWSLANVQFTLLTLLLLGFQAYTTASLLKFTNVPALLTSYPAPALSIGLIYFISALMKVTCARHQNK